MESEIVKITTINYKGLRFVDLKSLAKSRGFELWPQINKAEIISFIRRNDNIDQNQSDDLVMSQRAEVWKEFRERTKLRVRERDKIRKQELRRQYDERERRQQSMKAPESNEERKQRIALEKEEKERERGEMREFWAESVRRAEEEQELFRAFREAGWTVGRLGGRDRGLIRD